MTIRPRLPARFIVHSIKITNYLLDVGNPRGVSKARFFMRHGFSPSAPDLLTDELVRHACGSNHVDTAATAYGTKFRFEGTISTPSRTTPLVRSIWMAAPEDPDLARLITAYPI